MDFSLSAKQQGYQEEFHVFAKEVLKPKASWVDREQQLPPSTIQQMAEKHYLGAILPEDIGGMDLDMMSFALLNEELGRGCSSTRTLITVHSMVCYAIARWGSKQQKAHWLPRLASGTAIGAFALSEPEVGCDAKSVKTEAIQKGNEFILNGQKKWITFGEIADVFLIIAQCEGKAVAFLVEKKNPGLSTEPILNMLGTRGTMLSHVQLTDCCVSKESVVGALGFGFSAVALSALEIGRFSVATGSVGIAQACLDASLDYAAKREQFGKPIQNHQLVRRMLTDMKTQTKAARLLCYQAGYFRDTNDPRAMKEIMTAKYYAAQICNNVARDAVQIHGGNGCSADYPVERYYRDAKIMEIIEGSNEMNQLVLGKNEDY